MWAWSRNPVCRRGFRRQRSGSGPRSTTWADTGRGRSGRARAGRRRSDTPRLGSSRCARRCRCTGAAPRRRGALLQVTGLVDDQDRTRVAERVDDVVTQIVADRVGVPAGPRQQMLQPVGSGMRRGARRSSSNSCGPAPTPSRPSTHRHGATARSGRNRGAIRSITAENSVCHRSGSTL